MTTAWIDEQLDAVRRNDALLEISGDAEQMLDQSMQVHEQLCTFLVSKPHKLHYYRLVVMQCAKVWFGSSATIAPWLCAHMVARLTEAKHHDIISGFFTEDQHINIETVVDLVTRPQSGLKQFVLYRNGTVKGFKSNMSVAKTVKNYATNTPFTFWFDDVFKQVPITFESFLRMHCTLDRSVHPIVVQQQDTDFYDLHVVVFNFLDAGDTLVDRAFKNLNLPRMRYVRKGQVDTQNDHWTCFVISAFVALVVMFTDPRWWFGLELDALLKMYTVKRKLVLLCSKLSTVKRDKTEKTSEHIYTLTFSTVQVVSLAHLDIFLRQYLTCPFPMVFICHLENAQHFVTVAMFPTTNVANKALPLFSALSTPHVLDVS